MPKKKEKKETKEIVVDVSTLVSINDKHMGDLAGFFQEKLGDIKINKDGNRLLLNVPKEISRRRIKDIIKKYLHYANLSQEYRAIALQGEDKGYRIYRKPIPVE